MGFVPIIKRDTHSRRKCRDRKYSQKQNLLPSRLLTWYSDNQDISVPPNLIHPDTSFSVLSLQRSSFSAPRFAVLHSRRYSHKMGSISGIPSKNTPPPYAPFRLLTNGGYFC